MRRRYREIRERDVGYNFFFKAFGGKKWRAKDYGLNRIPAAWVGRRVFLVADCILVVETEKDFARRMSRNVFNEA